MPFVCPPELKDAASWKTSVFSTPFCHAGPFFLFPHVKDAVFVFFVCMSSVIPGLRIRARNFCSSLPREKTGSFEERNTDSTVHLTEWLSQK